MKVSGKKVTGAHRELLKALGDATVLGEDVLDSLAFVAQTIPHKGKSHLKGFANMTIREPGTDGTVLELVVQPGVNGTARLFRVNAPRGMSALELYQEFTLAKTVRVAVMKLGRQFFSNSDYRTALLIIREHMSELKVDNGRSGEYRLPDLGLEASLWQAFERGLSRARVVEFVGTRSRDPKDPHICARIDQELFERFVDYGCKIYPEVATAPVSLPVPVLTPAVPEQEAQGAEEGTVVKAQVSEVEVKNNKVRDWMEEDWEARLLLLLQAIRTAMQQSSSRRKKGGTMDVTVLKPIIAKEMGIEHLVLPQGHSFCYALIGVARAGYLVKQFTGHKWRFGLSEMGLKELEKAETEVAGVPKESFVVVEAEEGTTLEQGDEKRLRTPAMAFEDRAAACIELAGVDQRFQGTDLLHLQEQLGFGAKLGMASFVYKQLLTQDWVTKVKGGWIFVRELIPAEILRLAGFGSDPVPVKTNGHLPDVGTPEWHGWATGRIAVLPEQLETCDWLIRDAEQALAEARAHRENVVQEQKRLTQELAEHEERQEAERKQRADAEAAKLMASLPLEVLAALLRQAQKNAE
jgi:hypothetical protein